MHGSKYNRVNVMFFFTKILLNLKHNLLKSYRNKCNGVNVPCYYTHHWLLQT